MVADKRIYLAINGARIYHFSIRWLLFLLTKFYLFLENIYNIMANVSILFGGSEKDSRNNAIQVFECFNEIQISIIYENRLMGTISLDKETAIKFSKELRKQISLLEE